MKNEGAPARNQNAVSVGLHAKNPAVRVEVRPTASNHELAQFTSTLAEAAQWIAEGLNSELTDIDAKDAKLISLYASVGAEMAQMAAELLGEAGIKPAPLGKLDDAQFERLMTRQAKALSLVLSQISTAWKYLQARTETGNGLTAEHYNKERGVMERRAHPALNHMAASMRAAKRIAYEMASDRAWQMRGQDDDDDLVTRLVSAIRKEKQGE